MEELSRFLNDTYYITAILAIESLITAIIGLLSKQKATILKFLPVLAFGSFAQSLICFICLFFNLRLTTKINNIAIYVFILLEFLIVYHLMFQVIMSKRLKRIMYLLLTFFITFSLYASTIATFSKNLLQL